MLLLVFLSLAVSFEPFEVFDKIKVSTTDIKVNADFILEEGELTHQEFLFEEHFFHLYNKLRFCFVTVKRAPVKN